MSKGLNEIQLIGNLGKEPEIKITKGGKRLAKFSLAVTDFADQTTWLNVVAWEKKADLVEKYLAKGSKVYISGRLQQDNYERKDGTKAYSFSVVARNIIFLDGKKGGNYTEEEAF